MDRTQWEETHVPEGDGFLEPYDGGAVNGGYDVIISSANDRVSLIYRYFNPRITEEEAIATGEALMPEDGEFIEEYTFERSSPNVVRVYFSESLAERFPEDEFVGGDPGTYTIMYTLYEDGSETMLVTIGNDP